PALVPAFVIFRIESDEAQQPGDPPAAVDPDILILVGRLAPARDHIEDAELNKRPPARLGTIAVDVDDGLELHMVEQGSASIGRHGVEIFADALTPLVDAATGDLERAVVSEQVGGFVPQALVDIIAVGALEVA